MKLKTLFGKPVDRPIEGVIKADDNDSLRVEIEEYVLTNEVAKRLESFLEAYNNYEGANGVWISGFFGSGKSHLLKMLALLLEDQQIDGASALDLFLPKCGDSELLRANLKRAVAIPSKSILFNIDQKADVISKKQVDALIAVFVKVFDEMCGYFGKQGHIAQFERDLDSRGLYAPFKAAYESVAGRPWQKGREQALLETQNIAKAYAEATGADEASAKGVLDKYRAEYCVSIEDFAEQVHAYIEGQPPNFRLNFFVDEVGQYIAENIKLMTNLQTIAESLATKCRGRAWIIVTAQEDMGMVVGEMDKRQANDFSKIQARFANRMKLTSADVAEVVQTRLLTKNDPGSDRLAGVYGEQHNNFKTLFNFADDSQSYQNFQDQDHFIRCYPFIPYQFALFQSAIQYLSSHNAFEGRHRSVGERSMLGVFQQVAIQIGDYEIGQLATFGLMFEGIRTALKSDIQQSIIQAETHLEHPFAIQVLKTLFLVKYIKSFKPSVRNLCVLMLESFDQDLLRLGKRIEEALGLLEQQTYIQRNGDFFEYLTDEEKDVEQEIKNTDVETSEVASELEKIVFDQIIKDRKIRCDENDQFYPFSRKLDDRLFGREHELAINIITPFHEHAGNEQVLRQNSTYKDDEMLMILPADDRIVRDLLMYKRTEKYIRQNISITQREAVKRILHDKSHQNRQRLADLRQLAESLMGNAKLLVAGADVEIGSEDARTRVLRGFQHLITRAYKSLGMLPKVAYTENDIAKWLAHHRQGVLSDLAESERELLSAIQRDNWGGVRTTLKSLLEKFERKPYGWHYAAVLCTLASLCSRGKVEVRADGNLLEDDKLEAALRNSHGHANLVLEPQVEFTASQARSLRAFFEEFFDSPPSIGEAKALGKETGSQFRRLIEDLAPLANQAAQYPFLSALELVLKKLKEISNKPYTWYLTELPQVEDALLDMKERVIDPVRKFMNGPQRTIYDSARKFATAHEPNFSHIEGGEAEQLTATLADPDCFKGNRIQQLKTLVESLRVEVAKQTTAERAKAAQALAAMKDRLRATAEFNRLNGEQQGQVIQPFNDAAITIEHQELIAVIRDTLRSFEEARYPRLLSRMTDWAQPGEPPKPTGGQEPQPTQAREPRVEYVSGRSVNVVFDQAFLASEADVERYLDSMREALMEKIRQGKRIQV